MHQMFPGKILLFLLLLTDTLLGWFRKLVRALGVQIFSGLVIPPIKMLFPSILLPPLLEPGNLLL